MKTITIHYGFDIRDKRTLELTESERGTFDIEIGQREQFDSIRIQDTIRKMAKERIESKYEEIIYANFHKIEGM